MFEFAVGVLCIFAVAIGLLAIDTDPDDYDD